MNTLVRAVDINRVETRSAMLLPGVIGFYFAFRVIIVLLSVRLFYVDPQTGVVAGLLWNFLLLAVVVFHSLGPASKSMKSILQVPSFRWVLVFLVFSGCSLAWSETASMAAAVVYWCAMAADVAMVVLLLRTGPTEEMARALMKGYVLGACAVAFAAWILPAQTDLRLGDEELLGPNQIGYACAFAFFLAQYLIRQKERLWTVASIFLAITLLRSLSKTTIVAFIAAQAFLLIRDRSINHGSKILLVAAAGLVVAMFWSLIASYTVIYENAGNQAETLTGRIGIWMVFLAKSLERPWIGHGFHSVWKVVPPFGEFEARHAHNELLQQFYAYGVAGVAMVIALYGSFYRQIRKLPPVPLKAFFLSLLVLVLIRGLGDTEAFDLSLPLWAIALMGTMLSEFRTANEVVA